MRSAGQVNECGISNGAGRPFSCLSLDTGRDVATSGVESHRIRPSFVEMSWQLTACSPPKPTSDPNIR